MMHRKLIGVRLQLTLAVLVLAALATLIAGAEPGGNPAVAECSAMQSEIRQLVANQQAELEALNLQFGDAPNHQAALDLQKKIQARKVTARNDLLRIQEKYARARGDTVLVREIGRIVKDQNGAGTRGEPSQRSRPVSPAQK